MACNAIPSDDEDGEDLGTALSFGSLADLHTNSSFESGVTGFNCYQCSLTTVTAADAPAGSKVARVVGNASSFSLGDWPGAAQVTAGKKVTAQIHVKGGSASRGARLCLRERNAAGTFVATTCSNTSALGTTFHPVSATHTAVGSGTVDAYVYLAGGVRGDVFFADLFQVAKVETTGGGTSDGGTSDGGTSDGGTTTGIGEISAANQCVIAYPPNTPSTSTLMAYAKPGGMVVLDPYLMTKQPNGGRDLIRDLRAGGAEVLLYVDLMEVPDYAVADVSRLQMFDCTAGQSCAATMPGGYFFPHYVNGSLVKLQNWPSTYLTDVTKGSSFSNSAVGFLGSWDRLGANGYFLDVLGTRLWTDVWTAMTASERAAWTDGVYDIVTRLRAAVGHQPILVGNNVWNNGHPGLNGFVIEHHDHSAAAHFAPYLDNSKPWHAGRRNMVIANGAAQAQLWRGVPGVDHVTPQTDYAVQSVPVSSWPFTPPR